MRCASLKISLSRRLMRDVMFLSLLTVAMVVPMVTLAAGTYQCSTTDTSFCALAPIPGLNLDESGKPIQPNQEGVAKFLNNLYFFAIGIAVILAIGMIIYGGVEYALSEAITSKGDGRRKIMQALFGLVLVLAPALVFSIINPEILKLNVNMEPLQTKWGTYAQGSYNGSSYPCSSSGCTADAAACTTASGGSSVFYYECKNGAGAVTKKSTTPVTCATGETYAVECLSTGVPPPVF